MDSTNTSGLSGAHLQQQYNGSNTSYNFISDMDTFTNDDPMPGNDDFHSFPWDPALFAPNDVSSTYPHPQQQTQQQQPSQQAQQQTSQHQQQPLQANLNQTLTRQSNSPALQPHHPTHSAYPPSNYAHSMYDHRNLAQPSFDDRFMSRPSASPTSFEHHQAFPQLSYNSYEYQQQYARPPSAQNPYYAQRSVTQPQTLMNITARQPPQHAPTPQMDNIQIHPYSNAQRVTHAFVNPSMINSSHMVAMNGNQQQPQQQPQQQAQAQQALSQQASQQSNNNTASRQQYQPSQYFQKVGSAMVDPQILHAMQAQNYPTITSSAPQAIQSQQQQQSHLPQPSHSQLHPQQYSNMLGSGQPLSINDNSMPSMKPAKDPSIPKKVKAPKAAKVNKDKPSDSDSSDGLEIEDEPPEVKPALLVVSPPTDEKGKALYSAVEAVWYPRNRSPQAEDVRRGIAAFGETVRSLRDSWKAKNDSLKKAELPNSGTATEVPRLKEDVAHYRQTMEGVMLRSLQYGHDAIVKRLGENQFTLSALYSFLLDRHNVSDFDSTLVNSIFKFAVKFETLDDEMLEQVKWLKVLQRIAKKALNDSKDLAQKILNNAHANTLRKKNTKTEGVPGSPSSVSSLRKGTTAGVKRMRDADGPGITAPKKIVKPASKPLALQSAERRKALEKEQKAALGKSDKAVANPNSAVASRPKVSMTAPPKANVFAGLSLSKKPGTSNAERAAAAAASVSVTSGQDKPSVPAETVSQVGMLSATKKKEEPKKESPPRTLGPNTTKTASSFLGFLADMDKPKEAATKKIEIDPNETEEQRAKRLRKEARRKLRVSFKPDNELVQIKIFTHDPEEETGQTDNMMRDAGDTHKEGEMLKRYLNRLDMQDDDEEEEASLEEFGEYTAPLEVDFSTVEEGPRSLNFSKFGGPNKAESTASAEQTKLEQNTLMATYTFQSDRPDTPQESPDINDDDDDDDFQPVVDFGDPGKKIRDKEKKKLAEQQPPQPSHPSLLPGGGIDLAASLRALGIPQAQPQQQQQQQAMPFSAPSAQTPFNPYDQQQSFPQPSAPSVGGGIDLQKLLAVVQQAKHMQQPVAPPQQQPVYQAPPSNIPPNVAAILAQMNGQQNLGLPLGSGSNPNPFPGNDDMNRKHGRSDDGVEQSGKKKKKGTDGKPYNYKTITCSFWLEGKCTKGENCTYKHEV